MRKATLFAFVLVFGATTLSAALSEKYAQFATGPEKWLITRDEQRGWEKVGTDAAAENFIQLFWARRDPTPGTVRNEFREEFEARAAYADQVYRSRTTRGALTDMGRVYLLLGPPLEALNMGKEAESVSSASIMARTAAKKSFTYANAIRLNLTGPIFFVENAWGEYKLDFQKGGVAGALSTAVNKAIVNPKLREVPNWARATAPETQAGAEVVTQKVVDVEMQPKVVVAPENVGANQLTLLKDVFVLQPQSGRKPLEGVTGISNFTRSDELGWAATYCGNSDVVRVSMIVAGTIKGRNVTMSAPAEEMSPDAIKATPGCYLVRGAIPLEEMDQGQYKLTVRIEDPSTMKQYDLAQDFRVE